MVLLTLYATKKKNSIKEVHRIDIPSKKERERENEKEMEKERQKKNRGLDPHARDQSEFSFHLIFSSLCPIIRKAMYLDRIHFLGASILLYTSIYSSDKTQYRLFFCDISARSCTYRWIL